MTPVRYLILALLLAIAGLGLRVCSLDSQLQAVRSDRDRLNGAVAQQTREAEAKLAALTAERDARQTQINEARKAQELSDAANASTIDVLARRLDAMSRAGGGGGLRDPHAAGCRRGSAQAAAAPAASPGPEHAPEAPGLLSEPFERLLIRLTREADAINAAYASCRADALNVRGLTPVAFSSPDPITVVREPP